MFLKNSPYAAKLGNAGLFLRQLQARAGALPNLTTPRLGNPLVYHDRLAMSQLTTGAPQLQMQRTEQVAALPLGARVKVDAWSSSIELVKARPVPLLSAREKMPFEVTPLRPYLKRQAGEATQAPQTESPETAAATAEADPAASPATGPAASSRGNMNIVRFSNDKRP